jgi:UDP-GlcNAc:undecaprenyl-phosphate/decaprenyl-phosphate GlcNAc-1-phosphate transferase
MTPLLWLAILSFGLSIVLTPITRDIFRSFNLVDRPDQTRKLHGNPIPRVGGIAIFISYFVAFNLLRPEDGGVLSRELDLVWKIMPAAVVIFAVGLIDDFMGLKPWQKIVGQLAGCGVAYAAGVRILAIAGKPVDEWWSLPITVAWLLVCTNAFNLVDGLDGLAAGVGMFATLTIFTAAMLHGHEPLAYATLPLAGSLLGFLCFNFNPATVFLGDCGSLLLGFLLGSFGVVWTQKSVTLLGVTAPLMALSIPLIDVGLCVIRRWLRNQPIFSADRGHIHHRLLDRGLTPRRAVLLLYALCGLAASFSLLQSYVDNLYLAGLLVILFCVVAWIGIQYLGYAEFILAGDLLKSGEFQRSVYSRLQLRKFEKLLHGAETLEDISAAVQSTAAQFGFVAFRLYAGGQLFEQWDALADGPGYWSVDIPLNVDSHVRLARPVSSMALPMGVVPFIDLLQEGLAAKLAILDGDPAARAASAVARGGE